MYNILQILYYNKLYIKEFFINMNINYYYEYYFGKPLNIIQYFQYYFHFKAQVLIILLSYQKIFHIEKYTKHEKKFEFNITLKFS